VDVFTQPFCKKKNKGPCSPVKMLKGYMVRERLENPALVVCDDRPGGRSQVLYKIILFTESMWIWKRRCYWKISRLTRELAHKKSWCHEHELRYIIIEPAKPTSIIFSAVVLRNKAFRTQAQIYLRKQKRFLL